MARVNIGSMRKKEQAQTDGATMAMLAGAVVLNDYFDFADEEIREFIKGTEKVISSIAKHETSAKYVIGELEKMTGIRLKFSAEKS